MTVATLLMFAAFSTQINAEDTHRGRVTGLEVASNGNVSLDLSSGEDTELNCSNTDYPFTFTLSNLVSEKWFEMLMMARSTNKLMSVSYLPSSSGQCQLTALSIKSSGNEETPGGEDPTEGLSETASGNIAFVGLNGLNKSSFTASGHYLNDEPASAFDGYMLQEALHDDATTRINRGIWLVKRSTDSTDKTNPVWLQVDFGRMVDIAGMRIHINEQSLELGRSPRNVMILTSDDGENFTERDAYTLNYTAVQEGYFSSVYQARYVRVEIKDNYGDTNFIEIDEFEILQD